jgi:hypothetical protein
MSRDVGAWTTEGFRMDRTVLNVAKMMKSAEGTIEKNNCSNLIVKSKLSRQPETPGPRELSLLHVENMIWYSRCHSG